MRYGVRMVLAGVLALGLYGAAQAAPSGFTEQKTGSLIIDVPSDWKLMPKELLSQMEQQQPGVKILLGVQGPTPQGLPTVMVVENEAGAATQQGIDAMSDSDFKTQCDMVKENLKKQMGKDVPIVCEKIKTQLGSGLYMQMTVPTGGPEVENITLTMSNADTSVVANATLMKADEGKYLPVIKQIFESIRPVK